VVVFDGGRRRHGELVAAVWPSSPVWFYQQMTVVACGHHILLQLLVQRSKMWPRVCPLSETVHELAARRGRRRKARPMEPSFGAFRDVAMHTSAKKGSHFKLTTGASIGDRKFNWICSYVRRVKEIGLWIFLHSAGLSGDT
jgi:hypothetical protein